MVCFLISAFHSFKLSGASFSDEASIVALTKEKTSAGRRILQWLDQLLAKLGNEDEQERAFLNRARNLYAKALQQTQSSFPEDGTVFMVEKE